MVRTVPDMRVGLPCPRSPRASSPHRGLSPQPARASPAPLDEEGSNGGARACLPEARECVCRSQWSSGRLRVLACCNHLGHSHLCRSDSLGAWRQLVDRKEDLLSEA